jgi:hypothetical protein
MSYRRRRSGLLWAHTPAIVFADNFDRDQTTPATFLENSPVSSSGLSWTWDGAIAGGIQLIEQNAHCMTSNSTGTAYSTPDLGSPDMYVQYAMPSIANATGSFMCARLQDRNNFIGIRSGFETSNATIECFTRVGGTFHSLYTSTGGAFTQMDILRIEVIGPNYVLKKNGTVINSGQHGTSLTATKAGIVARTVSGGGVCDDFEASAL